MQSPWISHKIPILLAVNGISPGGSRSKVSGIGTWSSGTVLGYFIVNFTLWLFNIAMENCLFIDDFPSERNLHLQGIFHGYVK